MSSLTLNLARPYPAKPRRTILRLAEPNHSLIHALPHLDVPNPARANLATPDQTSLQALASQEGGTPDPRPTLTNHAIPDLTSAHPAAPCSVPYRSRPYLSQPYLSQPYLSLILAPPHRTSAHRTASRPTAPRLSMLYRASAHPTTP